MPTAAPSTRHNGVIYCVVFFLLFWWMSAIFLQHTSGISLLVRDCVLRAVFGAAALYLLVKDFHNGKWTDVIHFRNFKAGLLPGAGLFLVMLFELLALAAGLVSDQFNVSITAQHLFLDLFVKRLIVGLWEELVFRGFLLEGYFSSEHRTEKTRLRYAFLSFALFGLPHVIEYSSSVPLALFRFFVTGAAGFVFAAMYLYSHNLLCCMLLHFIYGVFAAVSVNSAWYVMILLVLIVIAFVIAFVYLRKEPLEERMEQQ